MSHKGPSLQDESNRNKFVHRLKTCEYAAASRNLFTDRQEEFIKDMRYRFDHREDYCEVGLDPWNPTVSQWNYLGDLYQKAV